MVLSSFDFAKFNAFCCLKIYLQWLKHILILGVLLNKVVFDASSWFWRWVPSLRHWKIQAFLCFFRRASSNKALNFIITYHFVIHLERSIIASSFFERATASWRLLNACLSLNRSSLEMIEVYNWIVLNALSSRLSRLKVAASLLLCLRICL